MLSIEDVLEILSIPLLGVIPESREILRASNIGAPVTTNAAGARSGRSPAPQRGDHDKTPPFAL